MDLDFCRIIVKPGKDDKIEIMPDFKVMRSKDLMVRGKSFYAVYDHTTEFWSTDEYDVPRLVDDMLDREKEKVSKKHDGIISVKYMNDFSSSSWLKFRNYIAHLSDSAKELDENLTFSNTEVKKGDYVSRRLPYPLAPGDHSAFDEILNTLYEPEEAAKILWAIGAIVSGDSKKIQKFLVFYGAPGAGKGTILEIIMKLFEGYYTTFEAKALTGSNAFATEAFKANPLIAIDPDGDMSRIEDNTKLNSIVGHEPMTINEKYKPQHTMRVRSFLIMATNKPVKITDAKSGLIRRMIDVHPSGARLSPRRYQALTQQIDFELGAIAHYCLEVYRSMGRDAYSGYKPIEMMLQTDIFFNFIEAHFDIFKEQDGVTLQQAFDMYKTWASESNFDFAMNRMKLREELRNYFQNFEERAVVNNVRVRSWYSGFTAEKYKAPTKKDEKSFSLVMDETESILDELYSEQPAQYTTVNETPLKKWADVTTKLDEIDTTKLHYVKPPANHIVIDFDLKDANGAKSAERNLEAASTWPVTYAEYSKSGAGVHLHYIYDGDVSELSRVYDDGIEIKVFTGDSSLRRKLLKCNNIPVAVISSGLPIKEKKKMLNTEIVKSERTIRDLIDRNLRKEIHSGTKPSIDFIKKILDETYASGLSYDVSDLKQVILQFAARSTNQPLYCIKLVKEMKFRSADRPENDVEVTPSAMIQHEAPSNDDEIYFYDVEVFPNLFMICYKKRGSDVVIRMINPNVQQIEQLMKLKLVGFYNRKYDNHILWAAYMGFKPNEIYGVSKRLVSGDPNAYFGEAYNISYADILDFSSKKQSLKKFQIELGLVHKELGLPWDEPVPEELWDQVEEYCVNDVITTEQVFESRIQDFVARQILADLSGLSVNDTTQRHTARIIFGDDRKPWEKFNYVKLAEQFPGYEYSFGKSTYKGREVGEGGFVDADPGIYEDVVLLDITSMHPTSLINMNMFGDEYTPKFKALLDARVAIKNEDFEAASKMLDGKLEPYLKSKDDAEALSYALKIVVNIVYGLTSAKFQNPFKDPRNVDNIVAKRGALFMIDLKEYVNSLGYEVVHIKTDSIKIPGATPEVIQKVMDFAKKYGYNFEHEKTFSKFALVNKAVYVAKIGWAAKAKDIGKWDAVGTQFQHPYVFKTLFSKEPIVFRDKCEEKHVKTALYLDFSATSPMIHDTGERNLKFIGKGGLFCPIKEGRGGALLLREKDGKYDAATGTKGYEWLEADYVQFHGKEDDIDLSYFDNLVNAAVDTISEFGDFEALVDDGNLVAVV
jgi:Family of unknown function (DUF5906)